MRRIAFAFGVFVLSASLAAAEEFKVVIATWRGCEEACQGFRKGLEDLGIHADLRVIDSGRDASLLPAILAEARKLDADLIVTWGTSVSVGIAGTLEEAENPAFNHEIPQIFMIVADPVGAGLVRSLDDTGRRNLTGTYNRVPESVNIDTMRAYKPGFRRLGLIYNSNEPNSILKQSELAELAPELGFELVSRELPLRNDGKPDAAQVGPAVSDLSVSGVDFIYVGSSSFLRANGKALIAAATEKGIPVLSPYEELVREAGALMSVAARYEDVGRLAAEQAQRVLVDGMTPGDLPVAQMREFAIVINLGTARRLGIFPPLGLLQVAETID